VSLVYASKIGNAMTITLAPDRHSEAAFEIVVEAHLRDHGYSQIVSGYDQTRAIFPNVALQFIRAT